MHVIHRHPQNNSLFLSFCVSLLVASLSIVAIVPRNAGAIKGLVNTYRYVIIYANMYSPLEGHIHVVLARCLR
uniref:Putative secreted protein n=1 Tax=Anopheles darlingi TaxID=43151 RepID=A0A2M4DA52_ANODA